MGRRDYHAPSEGPGPWTDRQKVYAVLAIGFWFCVALGWVWEPKKTVKLPPHPEMVYSDKDWDREYDAALDELRDALRQVQARRREDVMKGTYR